MKHYIEFDAKKAHSCGFKAPYSLDEGLARTLEFEFVHPRTDDIGLLVRKALSMKDEVLRTWFFVVLASNGL